MVITIFSPKQKRRKNNMTIRKEIVDELLKDYKKPEDLIGDK
jgi:hypothetical protein